MCVIHVHRYVHQEKPGVKLHDLLVFFLILCYIFWISTMNKYPFTIKNNI